jgi:hypothetical protein
MGTAVNLYRKIVSEHNTQNVQNARYSKKRMRIVSRKFIMAFQDYSKSNAGKRKLRKEAVAEY